MNYIFQNKSRRLGFSFSLALFCFLQITFCKKASQPFSYPPQLSVFRWGQSAEKSIAELKNSGWKLKSRSNHKVSLGVPLGTAANLPKVKGITDQETTDPAELTLYLQAGKLMLARLSRYDTAKILDGYYNKLKEGYGLKKAIWSAKDRSSQDAAGNSLQRKAALYENEKLFIVVYYSALNIVEDSLAEGRNNTLEVVLYSKLNPGLTREALIKRLQQESSS